jgi:hypothetical protein
MSDDSTIVENNDIHVTNNLNEWNFYTFHRIPVIINNKIINNDGKSTVHGREIGKVFAEYKDDIVVIDGENKKEHEYLIPKNKIDRIDKNQLCLKISDLSLKEFEF